MNNDCIKIIILLTDWKNAIKLLTLNNITMMIINKYFWKMMNHKIDFKDGFFVPHLYYNNFPKICAAKKLFDKLKIKYIEYPNEDEYCMKIYCKTNYGYKINRISIIPREIEYWTDVCYFSIINNDIITVPKELANCEYLMKINLERNMLISLPKELSKLIYLYSINLSDNYFNKFPKVLCKLENLIKLKMSSNYIHMIPVKISQMKNLEILYLDLNLIVTIPETIGMLTKLRSIDLLRNKLLILPTELYINKPLCRILSNKYFPDYCAQDEREYYRY